MGSLVLILGDQLSLDVAALKAADKGRDVVMMAEVVEEDGWRLAYSRLDDPENSQTLADKILRREGEFGASEVLATKPWEWRVLRDLQGQPAGGPWNFDHDNLKPARADLLRGDRRISRRMQ